ncbi:MAG: 50S ribosomal protein L16 [Candidatus Diapherotrites archaeon]|nr:50S ribosomal protein L16 [Candidatus Diapherotrites archaeon]
MGLRPGKCYRNTGLKQRAYTRVAPGVPRKSYVKAAPALKIRQFNMGNPLAAYDTVADLYVKEYFDLRDNAIESARIAINRKLVKELGKDGFFMKIRVYPSHLLRENKQAQGAGADRVSQGMSLSFGVPIGRSARVKKGQVIFSVLLIDSQKEIVKSALLRAKAKFPCSVGVTIHKDIKSIGTLPKKAVEEVIIETKKAEAGPAEGAAAATAPEAGAEAGKPGAATGKTGTATGAEAGKKEAAAAAGKAPAKEPEKKGK